MATSWGQRRALGKKYSIDPALLYELEKLERQYELAPGREALALNAEQFSKSQALSAEQFSKNLEYNTEQANLNRAEREEANRQAGKSSMIGTAGNVLTTAATLRAMTKEKGEPFFGKWGGSKPADGTVSWTQSTPEQIQATYPKTVTPATTDMATSTTGMGVGSAGAEGFVPGVTGVESAATAGSEGFVPGVTGVETTGGSTVGSTVSSVAGPVAIVTAAEGVKGSYGALAKGWEQKDFGEKARSAPVAATNLWPFEQMGGTGRDFFKEAGRIEQQLMSPIDAILGIDNPGGAGNIFGIRNDGGTVICTELHRQGIMSDEIFEADKAFGKRQDLETLKGYHSWAIPLSNLMRKSKLVTWIITPIAMAWADNMAGKPNVLGVFLNKIGIPICRFIGKRSLEVAHG